MEPQGKYGKVIAPDTIRFERMLPGPTERVWAYLTDPEKRAKWLASGPMELHVGGTTTLTWKHADLDTVPDEVPEKYANGHSMQATITRCEPPYVLGYSWGARADALSEVVFELSKQGDEVLLVLTHHRLPGRKDLLGVSGGWHVHLDILAEHLQGRTSPGFWGKHARLNAEYDERIAKDRSPAQQDTMPNARQDFAKAEMLVRRPIADVFNAFIDPRITTKFWFTKSTGKLEEGGSVQWTWEMYGHTIPVQVLTVATNERIVIEWGTGAERSTVEWTFKGMSGASTFVSIRNSGLGVDADRVLEQVRDSTEGFTLVLAGAKAYLEHGIELGLVGDRFPEGLNERA
jgi:uncharacterized protein YndB with AHSA1/START domain